MGLFGKKNQFQNLQDLFESLVKSSEGGKGGLVSENGLDQEEAKVVRLVNKALGNYKSEIEYGLMKYNLTTAAMGGVGWDLTVVAGDPGNPDNTVVWSDEFRRLLGFNNEKDFPNTLASWSDLLHPDDSERTVSAFVDHLLDYSGNTPYDVIYRTYTKSGELRYHHAIGATMRDSRGLPLKVAGVVEDVTDKRLAEEREEKEREELENNALRLDLLLDGMKLSLWDMLVDPNDPVGGDNMFWWSDKLRKMLGYTDENDFPNVLSSWSESLHPDDKDATLNAFATHIMDTTGRTPYDLEYRLRMKTGEYRHFHAIGSTKRDAKGNPIRVAGALKDITEQKEAQIRLEESQSKLEESSTYINKLMKEVETVSSTVSYSANLISESNADLAGGVSAQATAIEELSASIGNMNEQLKLVYQDSSKANDLSKNVRSNAFSGGEKMQEMMMSIEGIKSASDNIAKIIKTIEGIAFKTKLLALNASVEAARAGEHGKSFAVVAEEVGNLAKLSQDAAEETSGLIRDTVSKVEKGAEIAKQTTYNFEEIVSDFEKVSELVSQVTEASLRESETLSLITSTITQISDITNSNSLIGQEAAKTSQELARQSEILTNLFIENN